MKILICGDLHFRLTLPYATAFEDGRKKEWEDVKNTIIEASKKCDRVIFLGDIFNLRHNHSSVIKEFIEFLRNLGEKQLYMISGNHDLYGKQTSIDFIQKMEHPNWHVYTKITDIEIEGKKITFLPYMTPGLMEAEDLLDAENKVHEKLKNGGDVLVHHHAITGSRSGEIDVETWPEIILHQKEIEKNYKWIFGGHVHTPQKLSEQTYVAGNIFTQESGEEKKSVFILDLEKEAVEEIKLPVRGIYTIRGTEGIDKISEHSIVKCIVTKRNADVDKMLTKFDATLIVEQNEHRRQKVAVQDIGGMDLSLDNLLKLYAEEKKIPYQQIKDAMELLENYE